MRFLSNNRLPPLMLPATIRPERKIPLPNTRTGLDRARLSEESQPIDSASGKELNQMPTERLQKIIAAAGIASRRKAEQFIAGGLVSVNGQVVTELGTKADP